MKQGMLLLRRVNQLSTLSGDLEHSHHYDARRSFWTPRVVTGNGLRVP